MSSAALFLRQLKLSQLKTIATNLGVQSSGTKTALQDALHYTLDIPRLPDDRTVSERHIVSVDMGVKNLAFCRLVIPRQRTQSEIGPEPIITRWTRVNVAEIDPVQVGLSEYKPMQSSGPETAQQTDNFEALCEVNGEQLNPMDLYAPFNMSQRAYSLVSELISWRSTGSAGATKPISTTILIERQRFRSFGGPSVQEWTLRVNMLEAMIYAILATLKATQRWNGNVVSLDPGAVNRFWEALNNGDGLPTFDDTLVDVQRSPPKIESKAKKPSERQQLGQGDADAPEEGPIRSQRVKQAKIELVEKWLRNKDVVEVGNEQVQAAVDGYLRTRSRRQRKQATKMRDVDERSQIHFKKLDDMADCLLQAIAYTRWEQNRIQVLEHIASLETATGARRIPQERTTKRPR